jgi:hypothetical protein
MEFILINLMMGFNLTRSIWLGIEGYRYQNMVKASSTRVRDLESKPNCVTSVFVNADYHYSSWGQIVLGSLLKIATVSFSCVELTSDCLTSPFSRSEVISENGRRINFCWEFNVQILSTHSIGKCDFTLKKCRCSKFSDMLEYIQSRKLGW